MSEFFTSTPPLVLHKWLKDRIGLPWSTDFCALARVVNSDIVGVVGYEGLTGTACRMHMAGEKGWITREFIRLAFMYPFQTLGLKMVLGVIPSGNTVALDIDLRLGFKQLLYIPDAHPDGGLHLLQMTRDDWKRSKWYVKEGT